MHDTYGIDVDDAELMDNRSWRWLKIRILGLLDRPASVVSYGLEGAVGLIPTTRVGYALDPPNF